MIRGNGFLSKISTPLKFFFIPILQQDLYNWLTICILYAAGVVQTGFRILAVGQKLEKSSFWVQTFVGEGIPYMQIYKRFKILDSMEFVHNLIAFCITIITQSTYPLVHLIRL